MNTVAFRRGKYVWNVLPDVHQSESPSIWDNPDVWFEKDIQLLGSLSPNKTTLVGSKENFFRSRRRVVIKRYRAVNWTQRIKDTFRISRARRAFLLGVRLLHHRVATAQPLAAAASRDQSILVTEFLENALPLEQVRREPRYRALQIKMLRNLARTIAALFRLRLLHTDVFTSNFFIELKTARIILIDLDGLRHRPSIIKPMMTRNLAVFIRRLKMTEREQCWFLAQFVRSAKVRWTSRDLLRKCGEHLAGKFGKALRQ